jgi:hypothetical protein
VTTAQDRVNAINARATRATEDVLRAHREGHTTRAEQDTDLERIRKVASIRVQRIRAGN